MTKPMILAVVFSVAAVLSGVHAFAQHPSMPPGMTHEQHLAQMQKDADLKRRGAEAMGFDQDTTTHHFALSQDGGAIDVAVKNSGDTDGRNRIRVHLKEIAADFAHGIFSKPAATHAEMPPGARTMQARRAAIAYAYEETSGGGRVRISTRDRRARTAIHEFLRYQIAEHGTGDPLAPSDGPV